MQPIYRLTLIALYVIMLCFQLAQGQNLLHQPESVIYDNLNDRYLVSNYENGNIVAIDNAGNHTYFDTTLTRIAGLMTRRDTLFVASNLEPYIGLVAYSLVSDEMLFYLPIPSVGLLNDLDYDNRGYIYISDYWDNKIFRVEMSSLTCSLFVPTIAAPNGVLCDTLHNRLLVLTVNAPGNPIVGVDFDSGNATTVVNTGVYSLDGITRDSDYNIYISSWNDNACYSYDSTMTNPPALVSSGHDGPADIYVDQFNDRLCVPNFYDNSVEFIELSSNAIAENVLPETVSYSTSYPNPFNARTVIEYTVSTPADVSVSIYDVLGNMVTRLRSGNHEAGSHRVTWSVDNYASGIYFYRIESADYSESKRMVLLK